MESSLNENIISLKCVLIIVPLLALFMMKIASANVIPTHHERIQRCCDHEDLAEYRSYSNMEQTMEESDNSSESQPSNEMQYYKIKDPWNRMHLTYSVKTYSSKLSKNQVDKTLQAAFNTWSEVSQLTFEQKSSSEKAYIEIRFSKKMEKNLGQAHYPKNGGTIEFNDEVNWVIGYYQGIDFFQVAVHEIGHAIGLGHSKLSTAVMYKPYRHETSYNFKFDPDDIAAVQKLYGKPLHKPESSEELIQPDYVTSESPPPIDTESPEEHSPTDRDSPTEPPYNDPQPPNESDWQYPRPHADPQEWWWYQHGRYPVLTEQPTYYNVNLSEAPPQLDFDPPKEPSQRVPELSYETSSSVREPSNYQSRRLSYACFRPFRNNQGEYVSYFYEYDTGKYAPYYFDAYKNDWAPYNQEQIANY